MRARALLALFVPIALCAPSAAAQGREKRPPLDTASRATVLAWPRPELIPSVDTNDVESYLDLAKKNLRGCEPAFVSPDGQVFFVPRYLPCRPRRAAAAALWASRLAPGRADAHAMAWRALQHIRVDRPLIGYKKERRAADSIVALRIDSLYLHALNRDPFATVHTEPMLAMFLASKAGGKALRENPEEARLRVYVASTAYHRRQFDSSLVYLDQALAALAKRDSTEVRPIYESKAVYHYAIAQAWIAKQDKAKAREALRRAVEADVSFYPAHAKLGVLAWEHWADSAEAVRELDLAVQIGPQDAALQYDYGTILLQMGRPEPALAQFERAIAIAPHFADSYLNAGIAAERVGRPADAARLLREFTRRAPRTLFVQIEQAQRRAAQLESATGGTTSSATSGATSGTAPKP